MKGKKKEKKKKKKVTRWKAIRLTEGPCRFRALSRSKQSHYLCHSRHVIMCSEEWVAPTEQREKDDTCRPDIHCCRLKGMFHKHLRGSKSRSPCSMGYLIWPVKTTFINLHVHAISMQKQKQKTTKTNKKQNIDNKKNKNKNKHALPR